MSWHERLRASAGALLGIAVTGFATALFVHSPTAAMWLIAPMGASAVLLFGVPASPLAQPWSIVGGNLVAAVIGVTCAQQIGSPVAAAAAAIFLAIAAMFVLRCLHPPSGAVALTAVLGAPEVQAAGYGFVLTPVLVNSLLLLAVAVVYNNATGRRYPHNQQAASSHSPSHPHGTADALPTERLGFTPEDLRAALAEVDEVLDISVDDLGSLFHRTEMQAFRRRFGQTLCADLMSRDVRAVEFGTPLAQAWQLMQQHAVQALPVVDRARRVIGIVTRTDFLAQIDQRDPLGIGQRLKALLQPSGLTHTSKPEVVGQIMTARVKTASVSTAAVDLVPLMAEVGLHHLPVVDEERRLAGMVTQSDLVGALYEICLGRLAEPVALAA